MVLNNNNDLPAVVRELLQEQEKPRTRKQEEPIMIAQCRKMHEESLHYRSDQYIIVDAIKDQVVEWTTIDQISTWI